MNILLTFDYELFFGSNSGTVDKCLIQPTERLLRLSETYGAKMTFFLDAGYLWRLKIEKESYPELQQEYDLVSQQINHIVRSGNDVQFHVHPHWERSFYSKEGWKIETSDCYKLSDFSQAEIDDILQRYADAFASFTGVEPTAYRAGGWCVQPFSLVFNKFQELGIRYDSSVMPGVSFYSEHYAFDFTDAPFKDRYSFENDVCIEDQNGSFTEVPISSMRYSALFFWRLYILGRLFPNRHKMLGDGNFVPQPGRKKRSLLHATINHVSTDGYFASKLEAYHQMANRENRAYSVVIGHPKSMTVFSFEKLERFIAKNGNKHRFITFRDLE